MNKTEKGTIYKWIAGILLIGMIALGANYLGFTAQFGWPKMFSTAGSDDHDEPITDTMKENYAKGIGKYQLDCKAFDSAATGTTRTIGTNLDVYFMHFTGGVWTPDSGAYVPASTNYYTAKPADSGSAWIMVSVPSGQAFYVDYQKMKQSDGYISNMMFTDVDGDGKQDFVFQYDLRNHEIPNSGYPIISFISYLITFDASFTGLNAGVNVTAIGTSTTQKYVESYFAFSAEKKGIALYQIRLKVNTTDQTKVQLEKLTIPGIGQLDGSAFKPTTTDTSMIWTYTIATTFNGADYLVRMPNALNKYYVNIQLSFTLASSDQLLFYLYGDYLQAQTGAGLTTTQVFLMDE